MNLGQKVSSDSLRRIVGKPPKDQLSGCSTEKNFPQTQLEGRFAGLHA